MADDRDFLDAAQIGDYHLVDTLLRKGQSADTHDDHGQTALALSAMYGHASVASRLIEACANPNARNEAGATVLMIAAEFPRPDIVRLLLASDADVNAVAADGRTALLNSMRSGQQTRTAKWSRPSSRPARTCTRQTPTTGLHRVSGQKGRGSARRRAY
jgi:ankyrin repeat protein